MKLIKNNSFFYKNNFSKNIKQKKSPIKCKKGNIFTGLTTLIVFSFILTSIILLNFTISSNNINTDASNSNSFNYLIEDYNRNIPISAKEVMKNLSEDTIKNHVPCYNSANMIKDQLQKVLNENNEKYKKNNGVIIESEVLSVYNGKDPYHINVKTLIHGQKGEMEYNNVVESEISIEGLKDPLPFLMCKDYPTLVENGTKISYNDALSHYLAINNLLNPDVYENATASLIIKRCPIDPYEQHGHEFCMKNCIENGYFHESADGSCYLCRLEGKGGCYHYGLEVLILPHKVSTLGDTSISGSDHVIFQDHYPGNSTSIYQADGLYEILILDDSHKAKYGMV